MKIMVLRLAYFSFAIICFTARSASSSSDFTSGIRSSQSEILRQLDDTTTTKHKPKKKPSSAAGESSSSSGGSSSGGSSSGGSSSGGASSSGGGGGGGGSSSSSNSGETDSPGGKGLLVFGVVAVGAIAASAAYTRPKESLIVEHPLSGALAKRVSKFETLAGKAALGLRPEGFNDRNQYNYMEDGNMRVV